MVSDCPDVMVAEGPFFNRNGDQGLRLAEDHSRWATSRTL